MRAFPLRILVLSLAIYGGTHVLTSCSASVAPADIALDRSMTLQDSLGASHAIADDLSNGKAVAFVFWQTWCKTCLAEGPALAEAARANADSIAFYGVVSGDDDTVQTDAVLRLAKDLTLPYPQIRDKSGDLATHFRVMATPTILVYAPSGREIYRGKSLPRWADLDI